MEVRNALVVLTRLDGAFPRTQKSGATLATLVKAVKDRVRQPTALKAQCSRLRDALLQEKKNKDAGSGREDLNLLAARTHALLERSKANWVTEHEFTKQPAPKKSAKKA